MSNSGRTLIISRQCWRVRGECVRWHSVESSGTIGGGTGLKTGSSTWIMEMRSIGSEAVCSPRAGKVTVSDGGATHTWVTTDRREGDKNLPDTTTVWKREYK